LHSFDQNRCSIKFHNVIFVQINVEKIIDNILKVKPRLSQKYIHLIILF